MRMKVNAHDMVCEEKHMAVAQLQLKTNIPTIHGVKELFHNKLEQFFLETTFINPFFTFELYPELLPQIDWIEVCDCFKLCNMA